MDYVLTALIGYIVGAVPVGLIVAKAIKRIDIREYGSGKIGTTNVLRTVGRPAAVLVLMLDIGKTVGVVLVIRAFSDSTGAEAAVAFAVLIGHNWPIFTRFKGGRGTAPGLGGIIAFSPWATLATILLGLPALLLSRYVSLGSLVGAVVGGLTLLVLGILGINPIEYGFFGLIGGSIVVFSHRDNIGRIIAGTERKLGNRVEPVVMAEETEGEERV